MEVSASTMFTHAGRCAARLLFVLVYAAALAAAGCQGIERSATSDGMAVLPPKVADKESGGALLRTGAFQLGRGVSHDLLRSQGDGLQGFPIP